MVVFLLYHAQAQLAYIIKFVDKIFVDCMPALCGNGAERLLENGENLLKMVVQCMDSTQPPSVRIEAFKLAQLLAVIIMLYSILFR